MALTTRQALTIVALTTSSDDSGSDDQTSSDDSGSDDQTSSDDSGSDDQTSSDQTGQIGNTTSSNIAPQMNVNFLTETYSTSDDSGSDDQTSSDDSGSDDQTSSDDSGSDDQTNIAPQSDSSSVNEDSSTTDSANSPSVSVSIAGIQGDNSYDPNPIEIKTGDSVTWTNDDNEAHTVTSGSDEGPSIGEDFDSGMIGSDDSYTNTFDKAGKYDYFCTIHPTMVGQVVVE